MVPAAYAIFPNGSWNRGTGSSVGTVNGSLERDYTLERAGIVWHHAWPGKICLFGNFGGVGCTQPLPQAHYLRLQIIFCGLIVGFKQNDQVGNSLTWSYCAPTGTRTQTELILSQLPLPLGYGGECKAALEERAQKHCFSL